MERTTKRLVLAVVMALVSVPRSGSATTVVVPNANAATEGNGGNDQANARPFNCNFTGFAGVRVQQVYLGSEVGSGQITAIAFRQNVSPGTAGAPFSSTVQGLTLTLSTTTKAPDMLTDTNPAGLDSNVGADVVTEYNNSSLLLSSTAVTGTPRPFDIVIPLPTPFTFDASLGNLLLDVTIADCTKATTTFFDVQATAGDSVSRAVRQVPVPNDGNEIDFTETDGLVTQFTLASADLAITKTDNPDPVLKGQDVTYTITVTNNGPDAAANVTMTDSLPTNASFVSSVCPSGWTCTPAPVGSTGGTFTATKATLASSATAAFSITVRACSGPTCTGPLSDTATVKSDTFDPDLMNNTATAVTSIIVQTPVFGATALIVCALLLAVLGVRVRSKGRLLG